MAKVISKVDCIAYKLVVITINYNNSSITIDCVNSILQSRFENFLVLLVDNGSAEKDYDVLRSYYVDKDNVIISRIEINTGYVGGVNHGIRQALDFNPEYFLIMNNDTILDKYAIMHLVEASYDFKNLAIISGKVYNMDDKDTLQYIGQKCVSANKFKYIAYVKEMREKDTGQYDEVLEMGMLDDIFWLLPRTIFNKVGYYSTDFFLYGEQNDYALRAIKAGFKLVYTPNAKIWHYHHKTTSPDQGLSPKIAYWQSYATMILVVRHLPLVYFVHFSIKYSINLMRSYFRETLKRKKELKITKARILGVIYFTGWLFHRKPNNGFNPYS